MSEIETKPAPGAPASSESEPPAGGGALGEYLHNLRRLPRTLRESVVRHGAPTSRRTSSETVTSNFFLHILSVRIHRSSLRFATTMGLGVITLVLFVLLVVTGILLMVYYKPSVDQAYESMKEIGFVVPTGRFMRAIHRWSAHGMVACVILHMARAFYTAAYKKPREFNWVLGIGLLVVTLLLSFTGYLLPWDQLAFWAITVGSNIAQSPQELTDALHLTQLFDPGGMTKELLLGAHYVGQEALIRFYVLHVMILPLVLTLVLCVHFWRIRKDGGLARATQRIPARPPDLTATGAARALAASPGGTNGAGATKTWGLMGLMRGKTPAVDKELAGTIPAFPGALYAIGALAMLITAVMLALGVFFEAPLKEIANALVPENPAKAPWYFLGLQELVSYSAFMGGVGIPAVVLLGLLLVPYLDREKEVPGVWFSGARGRKVAWHTLLFTAAVCVAMLAFTVRFHWLRDWFPGIPQLVIIFVNPGTVLLVTFVGWSLWVLRRTGSTRMGAIAMFTCFFVSFVILTYFATVHRGPNWDFYWWPSLWPSH